MIPFKLIRALQLLFYSTRLVQMLGLDRLAKRVSHYLAHHRLTPFWVIAVLAFAVPWGWVLFVSEEIPERPGIDPPGLTAFEPIAGIPAYDGQGLRITFIDVGQGDAALIRQGECSVLVDAGRDRTQVADFLAGKGILELDLVVATHAHADHIGGMPRVLYSMDVAKVWYNGQAHDTRTFRRFRRAVHSEAGGYQVPVRGDDWSCGEMEIQVLHPEEPARGYSGHVHRKNIVLRVAHDEFAAVLTGDIEHEGELEILESGVEVQAQVLELGHHGSRTSTHPDWLRAVDPEVAVWQAGENNRYGHPHGETLEALKELGVQVLGTAEVGSVATSVGEENSLEFTLFHAY